MSTTATSGRCSRTAAQQLVRCAHLGCDIEPGLDEEPGDPLAQEDRVVGEDESEGHARVEHGAQRGAGQLVLRDEAQHAFGRQARAERACVTTGCQDDERLRVVGRELARDVEPFDVGQPDVEQDEIRAERARCGQAGGPVVRLADHHETVGFEEGAGLVPEAGVVVDDEDRVHAIDRVMQRRREPQG